MQSINSIIRSALRLYDTPLLTIVPTWEYFEYVAFDFDELNFFYVEPDEELFGLKLYKNVHVKYMREYVMGPYYKFNKPENTHRTDFMHIKVLDTDKIIRTYLFKSDPF